MLLATGSIASAASRFNGQPEADVKCPKCKGSNGLDPPTDLLFRRFLWPRAEYDMEICNTFKLWAADLAECHAEASKRLAQRNYIGCLFSLDC